MMRRTQKESLRTRTFILISFLALFLLPQTVLAVDPVSLATIDRSLSYPTDTAAAADGTVYVLDSVKKRIQVYNSSYQIIGSISSIEKPLAVAVAGDGSLLVSDNASKTVKILDSSGAVSGQLMKNGGAAATFKLPINITVDAAGAVYVVDQYANSIEVFDAAGNYSFTIDTLDRPQDAVAVGDELFIIDQPYQAAGTSSGDGSGSQMRVSRIQIYNLIGRVFVDDVTRTFPPYGTDTANGEYLSLKGIGVDSQNMLYANDSYLNVVYKFDTDGGFLGLIDESLVTPLGTTVSPDGRLVATSSYNGEVKVLGVDPIAGAGTWMNDTPVASAGADQTLGEDVLSITLDGSGSSDSNGIKTYTWTQVGGMPVTLNGSDAELATFDPPDVGPEGAVLTFELVVTDTYDKVSQVATTQVTVTNVISGSVVINNGELYTNTQQVILSLDADEAVDMRFANESDPFGPIIEYATINVWDLSEGEGSKTVNAEFFDSAGNSTMASNSIILDTIAPVIPVIIDIGGEPGDIAWEAIDDPVSAVTYTVEYANNIGFSDSTIIADQTSTNIFIGGLETGIYYWRVWAVDAAGNAGQMSQIDTFTVGPDCEAVPAPPVLLLPDDATETFRTPLLETNDMNYPAGCGTHLRTKWQISESQGFETLVLDIGTTLDNLTSFQVPALVLTPATGYYWRVKHVSDNGNKESDWSAVWSFTTEAVYDEEGVDGVLYVLPEGDPGDSSGEQIAIKQVVGDAGVKIKTIRVGAGVITHTIKDLDPDTIPDTVNRPAGFPLGLLSFRMNVVQPGAVVMVKVMFVRSAPAGSEWYSYNAVDGWHVYPGAVLDRRRKSVTLTFQDGGVGDTDGVVNGIIVNP